MIRIVTLFVALLLCPIASLAETVRVRSGDHDGFTRLVVDLTTHEEWTFGRVDGGFELRPGRADIDYKLDRVFDLIGRNRVADVRDLGDGRLFLAVDCACHAETFALENGRVVLDVIAGPAREPGTGANARLPALDDGGERDSPPEAPSDPPQPGSFPVSPRAPARETFSLPLFLPRTGPSVATSEDTPETAPADGSPAPDASTDNSAATADERTDGVADPAANAGLVPPPLDPAARARVAETEAALLEQVARAAAQGLLDADMGAVEKGVAATTPPGADVPPHPAERDRPPPPVTARGHVTIETSVDRAASGGETGAPKPQDGQSCIDPASFDIAAWGEPIENGADIGAYRSRVIGEFDVADGEGVTALARNYVYLTFGAEAKALMRRYPDQVERPDLLFAMADIVDDGYAEAAPDLAGQMACSGATALWATLAQPELHRGQQINRKAVVLAFSALPSHLRRHLGPGLADDFLSIGDAATADAIRAAIGRAGGDPSASYEILSARLDVAAGDVDAAIETLDDVMSEGEAALPDSLLARVEASLASGGTVPEDLAVLLDSLAFQHRGTEMGQRMADAAIRARASGLDFDAAFAAFDAAASHDVIPPQRLAVLSDELFARLTQDADDAQFFRLTVDRLDDARVPLQGRRSIAARLLDLGFAQPARQVLGNDGALPERADRQVYARAALLEGRPEVAVGYLAGLDDDGSTRLRAEALTLARDYAGAARIYDQIGDRPAELNAAWRGGLWSRVTVLDEGAVGEAAALMNETTDRAPDGSGSFADTAPGTDREPPEAGAPSDQVPPPVETGPGSPTPLALARALIDESQITRDTLNDLLEEVASPEPAPQPVPVTGD